ncbi:hypothetical protein [Piscinibacter sp.]|uniref:hypothetical protein n=1 Tax=Piscinibacter sp. TaxID=1903157 RepID=UPI002D18BCF9|nr:hypothetical protein [Albitalea sp.]HUG21530.1 hypothetical protein [Albitalea sp.]
MANTYPPDTSHVPPSSAAHETPGMTREAAEVAKQRAGAMWDDAKDTARSKMNEQKDTAADGLGDVAGALHDAARRRGDDDPFARLTDTAADGLDRLSGTLRNKDVSSMLRDMDSFARNQPVAFFGLALAAGFVAVRLLKDSHQ